MSLVTPRLRISHAIKCCTTGERERQRERERERVVTSGREGERKYRPATSDRSHSDVAHTSVSSLGLFFDPVSTADLFEKISMNN
jgi:hypothetical protein